MERLSRAFLFHEALSTEDEGASVEEAVEHVLWFGVSSRASPLKFPQLGRIWYSTHGLLCFLQLSMTAFLYSVVNRHRVFPGRSTARRALEERGTGPGTPVLW